MLSVQRNGDGVREAEVYVAGLVALLLRYGAQRKALDVTWRLLRPDGNRKASADAAEGHDVSSTFPFEK